MPLLNLRSIDQFMMKDFDRDSSSATVARIVRTRAPVVSSVYRLFSSKWTPTPSFLNSSIMERQSTTLRANLAIDFARM